jgi:hypothetical protein
VGYAGLIGATFATVALIFLGEVLALCLVVWSALHLARRRPRWYVLKMLKGGAVGGTLGIALSGGIVAASGGRVADHELVFFAHLIASGFGWGATALARWYFPSRFEPHGQPI